MFLPLLLYALFSASFIFGKMVLLYSAPFFLTGVRMVVAGILILAYQFVYDRKSIYVSKKVLWPLCVLVIFNIYATNILEFWGLQYLTAAKACFLYNFSPFIAALFSYYMFKEKMTWLKMVALISGFLGFIPLLLTSSTSEDIVGGISFLSWPEIALLMAATATVYGWVGMKQLVRIGYSPITANGISMIGGGILSFATSFIFEQWNPMPVSSWPEFIIWMIPLTLVSNIICYNLYGFLLKKYTATLMTFVGFSSPFFTAIMGWIFLGETVSWQFFLSATLVFGSLYLYYFEELKQGYIERI